MTTILDDTKHLYRIVPIEDGAHQWHRRIDVGRYVHPSTGEDRAVTAAQGMLRDSPDVERVHVYHTHPGHGPMDRYVGAVSRGSAGLVRPS